VLPEDDATAFLLVQPSNLHLVTVGPTTAPGARFELLAERLRRRTGVRYGLFAIGSTKGVVKRAALVATDRKLELYDYGGRLVWSARLSDAKVTAGRSSVTLASERRQVSFYPGPAYLAAVYARLQALTVRGARQLAIAGTPIKCRASVVAANGVDLPASTAVIVIFHPHEVLLEDDAGDNLLRVHEDDLVRCDIGSQGGATVDNLDDALWTGQVMAGSSALAQGVLGAWYLRQRQKGGYRHSSVRTMFTLETATTKVALLTSDLTSEALYLMLPEPRAASQSNAPGDERASDLASQLSKLAELHRVGALSADEFALAKTRLLETP